MSKIDKEIEALGFEIRVLDLSCGYIVRFILRLYCL